MKNRIIHLECVRLVIPHSLFHRPSLHSFAIPFYRTDVRFVNVAFVTLDSTVLLYTYISRFSVTPLYISRGRKSGKATAINFIPNRSSLRLSTSLTNGPHSLLRVKVSTPSASLKESHARAHRAKHGAFRMGGAVTAILILKLKSGFV